MTPFQFGLSAGRALTKQAGGMAGFGKALGGAIGAAAKPAAKAAPAVAPAAKTVSNMAPRAAQTAAAAGTGAAAASQTPAGQNAMNTASNVVSAVPNVMNRVTAAFHTNPIGHQLGHQWHKYEQMVEPFDRAGMSSVVEMPMQLAEGAHKMIEPMHGMLHGSSGGH